MRVVNTTRAYIAVFTFAITIFCSCTTTVKQDRGLAYLLDYREVERAMNDSDTLKRILAPNYLEIMATAERTSPVKSFFGARIILVSPNNMDTATIIVYSNAHTFRLANRWYQATDSLFSVEEVKKESTLAEGATITCPAYNMDTLRKHHGSNHTSGTGNKPLFAMGCDTQGKKFGGYYVYKPNEGTNPAVALADVLVSYEKSPWKSDDEGQTILAITIYDNGFKGIGKDYIGRDIAEINGAVLDSTSNMAYLNNGNCLFVFGLMQGRVQRYAYIACPTPETEMTNILEFLKLKLYKSHITASPIPPFENGGNP